MRNGEYIMMLVIETQLEENYTAHNEDYDPANDVPYWKKKGGNTIIIQDYPTGNKIDHIIATKFADGNIEDTDYFKEYVINYHFESDDWVSFFENAQLEDEGKIQYYDTRKNYKEVA
jgi:hypothetical protein